MSFRFTILEHDHPFLHWDLLMQDGDTLASWRLLESPTTGRWIPAEALSPHRLAYLDYEGPVSNERGHVLQFCTGRFAICDTASESDNAANEKHFHLFDNDFAASATRRHIHTLETGMAFRMTDDRFHQRTRRQLQDLEASGQLRTARTVDSAPNGLCRIGDRQLVNFGGNDYLNLAHEVCLVEEVQHCFANQIGATASALVCGRSRWHAKLESDLAGFEGTESALLFPTGYAANLGVLNGLVMDTDAVFCDRENHASIIDASRSCAGRFYVYRRDQLDALEKSVIRRRSEFDQIFIVSDGVFSMDGSVAPLADICQIAGKCDCHVIVDEAHGTGVIGEFGRGACDFLGVEDQVLLRVGTMSKAMGGLGGFAVSDQSTIELLRNTARTHFFSTALPPAICRALVESIRVIKTEPRRRERLADLTAYAHKRARQLSLQVIGQGIGPIIPVQIGNDRTAVELSKRLQSQGWFVPAIRPPTVPNGTARLRLSLNVEHSIEQIDSVLSAISSAAIRNGVGVE